ncbi:hypothetical protein BO71DRAFT_489214 [Aspergillus ellipticus CBS 707.79]|uniref:Amine oxidase domain-containing protein n=1 Tax=Aspergillus ellipticus CBS 707.79 TaxID=1448320 RepID=A0A319CTM2_9EURO|nr:hypothetical protein BO71DRAFT_489214 [Aspergillus ellipticus CBS 707.79]
MVRSIRSALLALALSHGALSGTIPFKRELDTEILRFRVPSRVTADSLHNVHLDFLDATFEGPISLVYGDCDTGTLRLDHACRRPASALSARRIRINPIRISAPITRRESIADVADMMGPWFDGVAYMQAKEPGQAAVSKAKNSSIAILGGGMSGLMTSRLLSSVGIHNWHIVESSERVGGRIRTRYLNHTRPDQYQYQEMGPMRFPVSITYADTNETLQIQDHRMVFQLADTLNQLNADTHPDLHINFIPFIENGPNVPASTGGVRLPNGRIPTVAQVAANASPSYTAPSSNASAVTTAEAQFESYTQSTNINTTRSIAQNMYRAHKAAVEDGFFHWSEAGYLRYALNYNANITDYIAGTTDYPIWDDFYEDVYFAATEWRTIDKGLESLPRAFYPHIANKTTFGRKVDGLIYNATTNKIAYTWRDHAFQLTPQKSEEYDYAVVAAPFSKVRLWDLPHYSSLLGRAISTLNYEQACKISIMYETRFWEHQEDPIFGGCGSVDIPGVGSVCYPSYNLNGTGPGVVLASYISGVQARSTAALSQEDYVALVQRSMVQIHGEIAEEQFTGIYNVQCWELDEHQAGAWTSPVVGQQELYLPAYYQTEFKTIFIGEHTSYTHAWIFSALDSAVRGTTQLLLDLGLVDEAKAVVEEWMGRWIKL